ncbi:MAG: histidine phosphatase family protein [Proteobacteria bacterium]|nr:histidine phosphatase family protein [Pseudomonadota bacterium]MBU1687012.1 histidine phosphatase family protein [Pseudomonadota bacterium]
MLTEIFLTRHGVTAANLEDRFAGRTQEPLHSSGITQVEGVASRLKPHNLRAVYAGPLPRTHQSAEIICRITGAPLITSDTLTEIRIPHWDGLTKSEIRRQFGPEYPTWLESPGEFNLPGCETLAEVQKRAVHEMEAIFERHAGERVAVVSHLIVVRCLVLHYSGRLFEEFRSVKIPNGAITVLRKEGLTPPKVMAQGEDITK